MLYIILHRHDNCDMIFSATPSYIIFPGFLATYFAIIFKAKPKKQTKNPQKTTTKKKQQSLKGLKAFQIVYFC